MSQRHRTAEVPLPPKQELRAHAHGERHRIHVELNQVASKVSAGEDPSDVDEPGTAWKPMHHHDPEVAKTKVATTQAHQPPLEDEDVEAALEGAPGTGGGVPPRRRTLIIDLTSIAFGSEPRAGELVAPRLPILDGDGEAEMVLPHARDLQVLL